MKRARSKGRNRLDAVAVAAKDWGCKVFSAAGPQGRRAECLRV